MIFLWSFRAVALVWRALFAIELIANSSLDLFSPFRSRSGRGEPGGSSLFFASPKKSNQKKGDPAVCVPSLRFGQPAVLSKTGVTCKLAALRQARALIRFGLRSSAQSEGFCGLDSGSGSPHPSLLPEGEGAKPQSQIARYRSNSVERCVCIYPLSLWERVRVRAPRIRSREPVLAEPVMRQKSGIRAARCLSRRRVCADPRFSGAAQVARRAPDCGSPFFSLGFFGEAKKSKSPTGARPGLLVKGTYLANRNSAPHTRKQAQAEATT